MLLRKYESKMKMRPKQLLVSTEKLLKPLELTERPRNPGPICPREGGSYSKSIRPWLLFAPYHCFQFSTH